MGRFLGDIGCYSLFVQAPAFLLTMTLTTKTLLALSMNYLAYEKIIIYYNGL